MSCALFCFVFLFFSGKLETLLGEKKSENISFSLHPSPTFSPALHKPKFIRLANLKRKMIRDWHFRGRRENVLVHSDEAH